MIKSLLMMALAVFVGQVFAADPVATWTDFNNDPEGYTLTKAEGCKVNADGSITLGGAGLTVTAPSLMTAITVVMDVSTLPTSGDYTFVNLPTQRGESNVYNVGLMYKNGALQQEWDNAGDWGSATWKPSTGRNYTIAFAYAVDGGTATYVDGEEKMSRPDFKFGSTSFTQFTIGSYVDGSLLATGMTVHSLRVYNSKLSAVDVATETRKLRTIVGGDTPENTVAVSDKIEVKEGETLRTIGYLNFSNGENVVNAGGTLEVVSGETAFNASEQGIEGTLTICKGATFRNLREADALAYGTLGVTVNVYGTLNMGETRWTIGEDNTLNLYAGATVSGSGQASNGALDWFKDSTVYVKKVENDDNREVVISANLRTRDNARFNIEEGMTALVRGTINGWSKVSVEGSGTLKLAGENKYSGSTTIAEGAKVVVDTGDKPAWEENLNQNSGVFVNGTLEFVSSGAMLYRSFEGGGTIAIKGNVALNNTGDLDKFTGLSQFTGSVVVDEGKTLTLTFWNRGYNINLSELVVNGSVTGKKGNNNATALNLVTTKLSGSGTISGVDTFTLANGATLAGSVTVNGAVTVAGTVTVHGEAGQTVLTCNNAADIAAKLTAPAGLECVVVDETKIVLAKKPVVKIGETTYATFAEALAAASAMTGDVTVKILDKVTLNGPLSGSYTSIKFVGATENAEIYLDVQGYAEAVGKKVAFKDLKLSKVAGGYITNAGFMNLAFGIYGATEVAYTNCTFLNGAYASSGKNTFTGCTFYRSHDRYGLWAYGAEDIVVDGCIFADFRGIKMYDEGKLGTTSLTVKNTKFTAVDNKPAIVLTSGKSVTLENNTYSSTGVFELDLDGVPNGTLVTSDVAPTCVNDNGPCGVLVDGKIYTTVAQAAAVATSGSNVTLLHDSTETVELPEGVVLNKNGFVADGVTVKLPAKNIEVTDADGNVTYYAGFTGFSDLDLADCTIKLLNNVSDANLILNKGGTSKIVDTNVTLDLNGYTFSRTGSSSGAINLTNGAGLTIRDSSDAKTGKILVDTYAVWMMNGDFVLESGTIETTSTKNAAIYANAAEVSIQAGKIVSAGDAITVGENFIESRGTSTIEIIGGEIVAAGVGIKNGSYAQDSTAVTVTGGTIDAEGDSISFTKGSVQVSGGTFSSDVSDYCVDGFEVKQNADGSYDVAANPAYGKVAKIGENYYATLSAAFAAVTDDSQTVTILTDVTEELTGAYLRGNITTENDAKVTITLTNSDWVYCPYTFVIGKDVTLKTPALFYYAGGAIIKGTVITDAYYQRYAGTKLYIEGTMTVNSETFILRYTDGDANAGIYVNGGTLNASVIYFYQGMISATNGGKINVGTYWQTNETDGQGSANLVLDNSTLTVSVYDHSAKATGNSTVTLKNGSTMNCQNGGFTYGETALLTVDSTSSIIGKGGEVVKIPVAKIGGNGYTSLEDAFAAAKEGETIVMLADATPALTSQRAITKAATIDLGGKTLTLTEDDLYFGTTTFKNGTIIVDPSVKPSTAVFWMFANQTLTFDNVKVVATGVTGTYLIGLDGNNADLNVLNGSEIVVENTTALDLDIICVNASTGNDIVINNSKVKVTNLDGRVFFRGNYTISGTSDIDLSGITKAGFRIEAGQTLTIADTATVDIEGEPRDGGIHLTDYTSTYTKADTATVNATVNKLPVVKIGETDYDTIAEALAAAKSGDTIELLTDVTVEGTAQLPAGITIKSNGKKINGSIRMLGDLTLDGPLTITGGLWVGKSGETLTATLSGDKLTASYFMFQHGTYTINADIDAVYGYLSYNGTFEVNSTIHTTGANGEVLYINGNVTLNDGAVLDSDNSVFVCNDNAVLTLKAGSKVDSNVSITTSGAKVYVDATGMTAGATANITGTVTNSGNGTVAVVNSDMFVAQIESGKIVLVGYVAKIGEQKYTSLKSAVDVAVEGDMITLLSDVEQEDGVIITGKKLTVNLNGKTFTVSNGASTNNRNFKINGTSEVVISNGTMVAAGNYSSGAYGTVRTEGTAKVTLTDLKLYNYRGNGLNIKALNGTTVTMADVEIYSQYGGGIEAAGGTIELTDVVVEQKGMYTAPYNSMAISVNGGGTVTVQSGTYSTECIAAEDANNQGTSHGPWVAGVLNSGGTLIINGGTFSNDNFGDNSLATYARGAILADTAANIQINGGTFNALKAIIDITNNLGDASKNPSATLNGGTFSADPRISGLYASNLIKVAEGYVVTANNGVWTVVKAVAQIGNKYYETFAAAYNAAQAGETITLLADVKLTGKLTITKAITIDGDGHSIIADETAVWYTVSGKLNIKSYKTHLIGVNANGITLKDVVLDCNDNAAGINIYCAQDVVFDNVSIINATKGFAGLTVNGSTLTAKTALTILGNAVAIDISNGSGVTSALGVAVEDGTIFNLGDKTVKFASVANNDMTGAVKADGTPYFVACDVAYFYTEGQIESRTTTFGNGLTILTDVVLNKNLKVKGTLDLNGNDLTFADGAKLDIQGNTTITGNGAIDGEIYIGDEYTLTSSIENLDVTTTEGKVVVYENGAYVSKTPVAKIGETSYATLQAAIAAAQTGDVIDLLCDVEASEVILIDKSVTINGNGNKVTSDATRVFRVTTGDVKVTMKDLNMVNNAVRVGTNDIRGISIDSGFTGVELTLNNCFVDFTDASATDWSYAVNVVGGSNHTITINGGTYEGANVINIRGESQTVVVNDATLTSLYPDNDVYYGACIYVVQNQNSTVTATGTTFNGSNAVSFNVGYTPVTESNNAHNTTRVVAKIGNTYYTSLADALAAAQAKDTVTLIADINLSESITIPVGATVAIDLKGKTISGTCNASQSTLVYIENGAKLTVIDSVGNGKLTFAQGASNVGWTVDVKGEFVLESGTIELTGSWSIGYAVDVRPNSWGTEYTTGTKFVMNGGKIISSDGGIRVASSSAEGHKNVSASFVMNGGLIDTAWDGVFIQQSDAIYDDLSFTMNGGTIESDLNPVRVYGPAPTGYVNDQNCMSITLADGTMTYTGTEAQTWLIEGVLRAGGGSSVETILENGTFVVSEAIAQNAAPEGFKWVSTENGYTLAAYEYVAQIDDVKYESLAEAIEVAQNGQTIVLLSDLEVIGETFTIADGKTITLNMNGKKITATDNKAANVSYELFYIYGGLTVTGNGTIELTSTSNDTAWAKSSTIFHNRGGVLTIENGSFTHKGGTAMAFVVDNNANSYGDAYLYVNGGEIISENYIAIRMRMEDPNANGNPGNGISCTAVTGGYIYGANRGIWGQKSSGANEKQGELTVTGGVVENGRADRGAIQIDVDSYEAQNMLVSISGNATIKGAIMGGDDEFVVSGGTFTKAVPEEFCAEGFTPVKVEGGYSVGILPDAEVRNLGSITVGLGDYTADMYKTYDLIGGSGLHEATVPYDLTLAMDFKAKDTAAEAANNKFGNYTTDFFITMSGMSGERFVGNGCYLAGYYPSFKAWVKIPLDGFTVENGKVYPVITSAGFDFKYTDICGTVGQFICGIYLTPEVLAANPNLTVDLTLGLAENKDAALEAEFVKVGNYEYDADDLMPVELPEVKVLDIKDTLRDSDPDLTFALNFAIKDADKLTDAYLEKLFAKYGNYYTDYVLTISGLTDPNGSVKFNANGNGDGYLAGQYDAWSENWVSVPFENVTVQNGQSLYIMEYAAKLMGKQGLRFTLAEVAEIVQNFDCGVYFTPEFLAANPNLKVDLELKVFTEDENGNKVDDISVAKNEFDKDDFGVAAVVAEGSQTRYFASLVEAINAADGKTVRLLSDVELNEGIVIPSGKNVTLDLAGFDVTRTVDDVTANTQVFCNNGTFTITDSAEEDGEISLTYTGDRNSNVSISTISNYGVLNIAGGTVKCISGNQYISYAIDAFSPGTVNISGGKVTGGASGYCIRMFLASTTDPVTLNVTGGEVGYVWAQQTNPNANKGVINVTGGKVDYVYIDKTGSTICDASNVSVSIKTEATRYEPHIGNNGYIAIVGDYYKTIAPIMLDIRIVNGKPQIGFAGEGEFVLNAATALTSEWTNNVKYIAVENDGDDTKTWVTPKDGYYFFKGYIVR